MAESIEGARGRDGGPWGSSGGGEQRRRGETDRIGQPIASCP